MFATGGTFNPKIATCATGGTFTTVTCTKMLQIPVLVIRRNSITLIGY